MKAVVFHGVGGIRLDDAPEPTDAIVRLTSNAICGTDLHKIRGTPSRMREGVGEDLRRKPYTLFRVRIGAQPVLLR